jgi:O-antigen/teichoic acid export membrane protein/glycosyltransferase involved in cell wall biosynthesis
MLAGQGFGYGLRIVYFIVIARLLGVLQYGIVVGAFALVNLVGQYSRLGMGTVLMRYVAPDHKRFAVYWGNLLVVTIGMGSLLIVLLRVVAPRVLDPASAAVIVLMAVGSCLCEQVTIGATQAFQAFEHMQIAAVFNQLTSMLRTFAAIGMLVALHHATASQWAMALMVSSATAAILALIAVTIWLGWPQFTPHLTLTHGKEGLEYAFASSTTSAYDDLDKTMLSHYGMTAANGIYGIAYRIIEMGTVPILALELATAPRLFRLASSGVNNAVILGRRLLKHGLLASTFAAVCMFVFAPVIPLLAGKGFSESISALRWLCLIPVFRSVHKITGSVLTSIGLQRYRTLTQLTVVFLNFGLNLWLIPTYGWRGAAWASLATDGALGIMNWSVLEWTRSGLSRAGSLMDGIAIMVRSGRENLAVTLDKALPRRNNLNLGARTGIPISSEPLVSIIIPYYNQQAFIADAAWSAKRQTYPNIEIIVVDDGSPVPAEPHLRQINGIHLLRTENHGVSAARNLGFQRSSGEYLIFLDSDDVLLPGAVEAHLKALLAQPKAGLSFGPVKLIDEIGKQLRPPYIGRRRRDYFFPLLESNLIGCPGAAMIRREMFVAVGLFDEELRNAEDYELFLRIARHSPLVQHSVCVVEYRQHSASKSQPKERQLLATMAALDRIDRTLNESERKKLRHARRHWEHEFRRKHTLTYRLWGLYYRFHAMLTIPVRSYFISDL